MDKETPLISRKTLASIRATAVKRKANELEDPTTTAFQPSTILALLDHIEQLDKTIAALRRARSSESAS